MVQLSHPYMTTGKIIALTRQTFVGKVMSLFFNKLSRLVIAFLVQVITKKQLLITLLMVQPAGVKPPLVLGAWCYVTQGVCRAPRVGGPLCCAPSMLQGQGDGLRLQEARFLP